ncbi:MAG: hypothetical protein HQL54_13895 [Magnetococcales bacterium]|nr:hypothetical protein [Magnetococcales bacterium]
MGKTLSTENGPKSGFSQRLLRQSRKAILIRITTALLSYGLFVVLARWMSDAEFGRLAFGISVALSLALIGGVGQYVMIMRFLGQYAGTGRPDLAQGVLRFSGKVTLYGALGSMLLAGFGGWIYGQIVPEAQGNYLYAAALLVPALVISEYTSRALRGVGLVTRALGPKDVLWRPVALLALFMLFGTGFDAVTALLVLAAVLFVLVAVQYQMIYRPIMDFSRSGVIVAADDPVDGGSSVEQEKPLWRKTTRTLWMVAFLGPAFQHLTIVVLGLTLSPEQTGPFFAALRTAATLTFPLQAINIIIGPMIARNYAKGEISTVQYLANFSAVTATVVASFIVVLLFFFGDQILTLFNPSYAVATPALLIMAVGFLVSSLCGSIGQIMTMIGAERVHLRILSFTTIIALGLITLGSSLYGIIGAAYGFVFGITAWNILDTIWLRWRKKIDSSIFGVLIALKSKIAAKGR